MQFLPIVRQEVPPKANDAELETKRLYDTIFCRP